MWCSGLDLAGRVDIGGYPDGLLLAFSQETGAQDRRWAEANVSASGHDEYVMALISCPAVLGDAVQASIHTQAPGCPLPFLWH